MRIAMSTAYVVVTAMLAAPTWAQTERTGSADARVMQQLQQLTGERAALQAENAKLKQELDRVKQELSGASSGRAALESRTRMLAANAERGEAANKQAQDQLEHTRGQLQELIGKFRETAQTLREVETNRAGLQTQLAARERDQKMCVDRNAALYTLNSEVLDRMEDRGVWSALAEREPFTQLKRVQLENLSEDYRYRADELRLEQQTQAQVRQEK